MERSARATCVSPPQTACRHRLSAAKKPPVLDPPPRGPNLFGRPTLLICAPPLLWAPRRVLVALQRLDTRAQLAPARVGALVFYCFQAGPTHFRPLDWPRGLLAERRVSSKERRLESGQWAPRGGGSKRLGWAQLVVWGGPSW